MTTLTNTVQKQNKEIETLKGERLTVNCDCNGNNDDDDTADLNNATLQGLYFYQIHSSFKTRKQIHLSTNDCCTNEQIQSNMELEIEEIQVATLSHQLKKN